MSDIFKKYQALVLENVETITQIEGSLRTLLMFVPGRFKESELKLESAYSVIALISLFHDFLIVKFLKTTDLRNNLRSLPPSSVLPVVKSISVIQCIQLALEIAGKERWGEKGKWRTVFVVELIKALLKVYILIRLRGHTVIYPSIPQFRDKSANFKELLAVSQYTSETIPKKKRERVLVSPKKLELFRNEVRSVATEPNPFGNRMAPNGETVAELLHIFRPIIYLLAISKFGKESWKAWLSSFFVDALSIGYYVQRPFSINDLQRDELLRRLGLLSYYALRSPFFEAAANKTPQVFKNAASKIASIPGLQALCASLADFISVYRDHYFYTSGT